jgi:hypothetical protein
VISEIEINMTAKQYIEIKDRKFHPKVAKRIDAEEISLVNASILAQLQPDDQLMFIHEAENFSQRQFAGVVDKWLKLEPTKQKLMRQIFEDIFDAFEGWDQWTGNKATGAEQDEFHEMVTDARDRVLRYLHKIPTRK